LQKRSKRVLKLFEQLKEYPLLRLNTSRKPIAKKYREGKMKKWPVTVVEKGNEME